MASNLPAKQEKPVGTLATVYNLLTTHKDQIAAALPLHMTAERMIRIAYSAVSRSPEIAKCTPISIAAAVVQASVLGLEPNTVMGEAYLVPFWNWKVKANEVQLIPGYMGLLKLARQSGEVSMFDSQIVYSNDEFDFHKGSEIWWRHKWNRTGPRGEPQGVWAGYSLRDKTTNFEYWTIEQIEDHRDRYSKGAYKQAQGKFVLDQEGKKILVGAWADSPEWMWKKTVIRQTVKLMPKSIDRVNVATQLDDLADRGTPQTFDILPQAMLDDPDAKAGYTEGPAEDEPKRKSQNGAATAPAAATATQQPAAGPTAPPESAKAITSPRSSKIAEEIFVAIEAMEAKLGKDEYWRIIGDCGITNLSELSSEKEAKMVLGIMEGRLKGK